MTDAGSYGPLLEQRFTHCRGTPTRTLLRPCRLALTDYRLRPPSDRERGSQGRPIASMTALPSDPKGPEIGTTGLKPNRHDTICKRARRQGMLQQASIKRTNYYEDNNLTTDESTVIEFERLYSGDKAPTITLARAKGNGWSDTHYIITFSGTNSEGKRYTFSWRGVGNERKNDLASALFSTKNVNQGGGIKTDLLSDKLQFLGYNEWWSDQKGTTTIKQVEGDRSTSNNGQANDWKSGLHFKSTNGFYSSSLSISPQQPFPNAMAYGLGFSFTKPQRTDTGFKVSNPANTNTASIDFSNGGNIVRQSSDIQNTKNRSQFSRVNLQTPEQAQSLKSDLAAIIGFNYGELYQLTPDRTIEASINATDAAFFGAKASNKNNSILIQTSYTYQQADSNGSNNQTASTSFNASGSKNPAPALPRSFTSHDSWSSVYGSKTLRGTRYFKTDLSYVSELGAKTNNLGSFSSKENKSSLLQNVIQSVYGKTEEILRQIVSDSGKKAPINLASWQNIRNQVQPKLSSKQEFGAGLFQDTEGNIKFSELFSSIAPILISGKSSSENSALLNELNSNIAQAKTFDPSAGIKVTQNGSIISFAFSTFSKSQSTNKTIFSGVRSFDVNKKLSKLVATQRVSATDLGALASIADLETKFQHDFNNDKIIGHKISSKALIGRSSDSSLYITNTDRIYWSPAKETIGQGISQEGILITADKTKVSLYRDQLTGKQNTNSNNLSGYVSNESYDSSEGKTIFGNPDLAIPIYDSKGTLSRLDVYQGLPYGNPAKPLTFSSKTSPADILKAEKLFGQDFNRDTFYGDPPDASFF